MYVTPSTSFEAVAEFDTGLAGTVGVRVTDNQGATVITRQTSGISEYPAGSGVYAVTLASPGTAGQYSIVWDDGDDNFAVDELVVTSETLSITIGSGNLYVTRDDLKTILMLEGETFADEAIDIACAAASRAIDGYKGTRYYPTTEIRYYTPRADTDTALDVDDLVSLTSVSVDTDGNLSYDETWVNGTDFVLDPINAPLEGKPYNQITLLPIVGRKFPTAGPHAVKVAGSFGWAAAPSQVTQAAVFLANRFLTESRQAPIGILVVQGNEMVTAARIGRIHPDAAFLLDQLPDGKTKPTYFSVQLS